MQLIAGALTVIGLVGATSDDLLGFSASSLAFHMIIEHMIFFAAGALFAQIIEDQKLRKRSLGSSSPSRLKLRTKYIVACLAISATLIAVWHLPSLFAAASFDESMHQLQHASFIATGAFAFIALRSMPPAYLILFVNLIGVAMGISGLMLLVAGSPVFYPYSVKSQAEAGNAMLIFAMTMAVAVVPAIMINHSLRHELRQA